MAELLPFSKLLRETDALGRIRRQLNDSCGSGSGNGAGYSKVCELVAIDQSGANGIYTVRARDLVNSFAIGDYVSYFDTSAKMPYTESLKITTIDRSTNQITTDGKFTAAPVTTDFLILLNTKCATAGAEIRDYILALNVADQESDLLDASMAIYENLKTANAIHPLIRTFIGALNSHFPNGIDSHLNNHTDPVISTPTNTTNATVDIPDDEAKWFTAGDEVTFYDVSAGYRSLEHLPITSIGAEGSGTDSGTTLITLTGVWTTPPVATDYLMLYDRLCANFKLLCDKIGISLTVARIFPPETEMGTYAASAADAGTYTDGDAIDTDEYGDGDLEVEVVNQAIGVNDLVLAITAKYYDAAGDEQTDAGATCTIPATSVVGTRVAVTVGVANARYHDVIAVSNSNGNNGDDVKIISKLDRLIRRS